MHPRFAIVLARLVVVSIVLVVAVPAGTAFAQAPKEEADVDSQDPGRLKQPGGERGVIGEEEEEPRQEPRDESGPGQSDVDAETGAGQGEQEEAATDTGPPWTYQMARISLLLLVLMAAGIGVVYYRLVGTRRRGEA